MPVVLQVLGSLIGVAGLFMTGFGLPIRYQNLDNTMIAAGVTAIVGGLVLIGLGAALRELRRLLRAVERNGIPASPEAGQSGRSPRVRGPLPKRLSSRSPNLNRSPPRRFRRIRSQILAPSVSARASSRS